MIQTSMLDFARSGNLGGLKVTIERNEVLQLLGDPSDWIVSRKNRKMEKSTLWKYGDIEFWFAGDRLYSIFSDSNDFTDGGKTLQIDPWTIERELPIQLFTDRLSSEGISFASQTFVGDSRQTLIITEGGVQFSFIVAKDDIYDDIGLCWWQVK